MKNWKFFLTSVLCASLVFGFASCSNGSDDSGALLAVAGGGTNTTAPTAPTNPTTPTTPTTPKTAVTYTITFNANDGSENPATSTQSFTEGTSQALKTILSLAFLKEALALLAGERLQTRRNQPMRTEPAIQQLPRRLFMLFGRLFRFTA